MYAEPAKAKKIKGDGKVSADRRAKIKTRQRSIDNIMEVFDVVDSISLGHLITASGMCREVVRDVMCKLVDSGDVVRTSTVHGFIERDVLYRRV